MDRARTRHQTSTSICSLRLTVTRDEPGQKPETADTDSTFLSRTWMGLRWSAWMPLAAAHPLAQAQLASEPGVYRIRPAGAAELEWIGYAPLGVRQTVERLSRQVHMPVQPFDDPTGPALRLWTLKSRAGWSFEVSGAACEDRGQEQVLLRAYESMRKAD